MRISVIGAGPAGQVLAGFLANRGEKVTLYNRSIEKIEPLMKNKQITLRGALNLKGSLVCVTNNISEAVENAEFILVATVATAYKNLAKLISPLLRDEQTILLCNGTTFGLLDFINLLLDSGCNKHITVGELECLPFVARTIKPGFNFLYYI